jgi:hypothetical protein
MALACSVSLPHLEDEYQSAYSVTEFGSVSWFERQGNASGNVSWLLHCRLLVLHLRPPLEWQPGRSLHLRLSSLTPSSLLSANRKHTLSALQQCHFELLTKLDQMRAVVDHQLQAAIH